MLDGRELMRVEYPPNEGIFEGFALVDPETYEAVQVTSDIVAKIPNMRPLNAGELAMATPIESFTAVLLQLNMH